ncbi:hypothetical protein PAPYR_9985 [Paratrimastix pyriformis]|uniref:Uncharacterized protein n=1 Tax=Paratrimastix pyriformis TaxID=342808 RepID=A0ABQ8U9U5_9EUKA|nr:hypothetical protein PAPYR_9985 [Paratrimastix pyriformis]
MVNVDSPYILLDSAAGAVKPPGKTSRGAAAGGIAPPHKPHDIHDAPLDDTYDWAGTRLERGRDWALPVGLGDLTDFVVRRGCLPGIGDALTASISDLAKDIAADPLALPLPEALSRTGSGQPDAAPCGNIHHRIFHVGCCAIQPDRLVSMECGSLLKRMLLTKLRASDEPTWSPTQPTPFMYEPGCVFLLALTTTSVVVFPMISESVRRTVRYATLGGPPYARLPPQVHRPVRVRLTTGDVLALKDAVYAFDSNSSAEAPQLMFLLSKGDAGGWSSQQRRLLKDMPEVHKLVPYLQPPPHSASSWLCYEWFCSCATRRVIIMTVTLEELCALSLYFGEGKGIRLRCCYSEPWHASAIFLRPRLN